MSKSKTKTRKPVKSLQAYYDQIDFYSWWEQFSLSFQENGQHKYITVHSFIKAKTSDPKKREFLWWVLGPKEGEPRNKEYAKYPQFDWEHKRGNEFWCSSKNIEDIKHAASHRMSSIDEIKAIGSFNLDGMGRVKRLLDQLDSEFAGRLQLPNFSVKENSIRLNEYLSIRSKLLGQMHEEQMMFAKTRSVDMSQLEALLQIVGPSLIGDVNSEAKLDPNTQRQVNAMNELNLMMVEKAKMFNMKLPESHTDLAKKASSPITIDRKTKVN